MTKFKFRTWAKIGIMLLFIWGDEEGLLTPALNGGRPILKTGVIKIGVNGAGVKFGPVL